MGHVPFTGGIFTMPEPMIFEPLLLPDPASDPPLELLDGFPPELLLPELELVPLADPLPEPELLELELLLAGPELELLELTPELEAWGPELEPVLVIPLPEPLPVLPVRLPEPPDPPSAGAIPD
jgi:hypothetical protein